MTVALQCVLEVAMVGGKKAVLSEHSSRIKKISPALKKEMMRNVAHVAQTRLSDLIMDRQTRSLLSEADQKEKQAGSAK